MRQVIFGSFHYATDLGIVGLDRGAGGKYLILPSREIELVK